ncbi:MAG: class I adenylate-forming enzyme family protein [Chthoniobacteraceae bacterium]
MPDSPAENAVLQRWQTVLGMRADLPAVLSPHGGVERTFADIEREAGEIGQLAARYPARSIVAVQIGNQPSWPAVLIALFRKGLIPLPIGRHVESAELQAVLETCGVSAVLTSRGSELALAPGAADRAAFGDELPVPQFLKLTSGTTSAPRAIRFQAHQLVADCDNICETMGITDADVNFGVIPFSHSYGFSNLLTPLLCRGVSLVPSEDRLPRAILQGLAQSGATVFPGMPVFYEKLAGLEWDTEAARLRLCISAGAPLSAQVAQAFYARHGWKIHGFYGSSECGGIAYDASARAEWPTGFVGTAMKGVTVTPENAADSPTRIVVRSAAVGDGYFPNPDAAVLGGGRFIPGDLVEFEGQSLILTGRASDVINIAGRKLNPGEVESRVAACAGVRQAVVFGIPSRLRGEEPILCVSGEDLDAAALLRFCRHSLSEWQLPRDVWIVPEIATNERGKISRRLLADQYLAARG